mmetsp:Transcript_33087/g.39613  ORF Transcript_33087/g.39613 Transcript_33087/m.39613 type:complete len:210 (+) Transcript_33087:185-814(+)
MQTQPQLAAAIKVATVELQAGITAILRSWDALRTAVQNEWGGLDSTTKAENLRYYIFEYFDYIKIKKGITREDLEDHIDMYMEEEFAIVLEDESEKHVVQVMFELYEKCGNGDFSLSREVRSAQMAAAKKGKARVQTVGENEDSDDEMDVDDEMGNKCSNYLEDAGGFLFGPPPGHRFPINSPPATEKKEVEVDEDGFTMVPTKRKGKT